MMRHISTGQVAELTTRNSPTLLKQQECVDYLKNRNVQYLVHFTPVENLKSIFTEGILPRSLQKNPGKWTDDFRMDGHTDCSCFSISYPNYSMLYQKRKKSGMDRFAILLIDRNALLAVDAETVAYFPSNAAEAERQWLEFEDCTGLQSLKGMFGESIESKGRTILRINQSLSSEYATHPQAEILVKSIIPAKYIRAIVLYSNASIKYIPSDVLRRVRVECNSGMFWPQGNKWADYEEWRRANRNGYQTDFRICG